MPRTVVAGLDPATQTYFDRPPEATGAQGERLDCRVKPGNDRREKPTTFAEANIEPA